MTVGEPETTLSSLVQMRSRTDVAIPAGWAFFPVASYILWTFLAVVLLNRPLRIAYGSSTFVGIFGTLGFATGAGLSYLLYSLINRRNKHSGREQALLWEALGETRSRSRQDDMKVLIPLNSAERDFSTLHRGTHERSAILWALLVLIPYAGWIFLMVALSLLSQDFKTHERNEVLFLEDLDRTLKALGFSGLPLQGRRSSTGNTVAYAVLSVLTLGLISLYWLFVMVREPESHFAYHSSFEASLLESFPKGRSGRESMI